MYNLKFMIIYITSWMLRLRASTVRWCTVRFTTSLAELKLFTDIKSFVRI